LLLYWQRNEGLGVEVGRARSYYCTPYWRRWRKEGSSSAASNPQQQDEDDGVWKGC